MPTYRICSTDVNHSYRMMALSIIFESFVSTAVYM